jgi:hypothetical protein
MGMPHPLQSTDLVAAACSLKFAQGSHTGTISRWVRASLSPRTVHATVSLTMNAVARLPPKGSPQRVQ